MNLNRIRLAIQLFWFFAVFFGVPCFAAPKDMLPDKPEPQARFVQSERLPARGAFALKTDRDCWIDASTMVAAWTVDAVSTHELFAAHANSYEGGGLFNGSRSTAKVMAAWAGVDAGMGFAAYEWKNHVHNRYLHPLWRAFFVAPIVWHLQAAQHNFTVKPPSTSGGNPWQASR